MNNRRQNYRHYLLPDLQLPVELTLAGCDEPIFGIAVNMSVSGLAVQFENPVAGLGLGDQCAVKLTLPTERIDLGMSSVVVHKKSDAAVYGLRFLPLESALQEERRDKVLWGFLLEEQRRRRRQA